MFLLAGPACQSPAVNCAQFKTGVYSLEGKHSTYRLTRTATEQIEEDLITGSRSRSKLHWLNDCTYTLEFIESTDRDRAEQKLTTVKIIKTAGKVYYFDAWVDESDVQSGRMEKIK